MSPRITLGRRRRPAKRSTTRAPAPFVVGVNRSGTTLLRMMLDAHPQLAIPPETHFIPLLVKAIKKDGAGPREAADFLTSHARWGDFGLDEAELRRRLSQLDRAKPRLVLRTFYELYAEREGKPRWGDKTPRYVKYMGLINRHLPEARFIHLIRDGRDVAVSREGRLQEEELSPTRLARIWKRRITRARRQRERLRDYVEIRYEDLVRDPEPVLRRICGFIELDFDPAMLEYHRRAGQRLEEIARDLPGEGDGVRPAGERLAAHSLVTEPPRLERVGRWRELMSAAEVAEFEAVAGDLLVELGYETAPSDSVAAGADRPRRGESR